MNYLAISPPLHDALADSHQWAGDLLQEDGSTIVYIALFAEEGWRVFDRAVNRFVSTFYPERIDAQFAAEEFVMGIATFSSDARRLARPLIKR